MTDQHLRSSEIYLAAVVVGGLFVGAAAVTYAVAPEHTNSILTALGAALTVTAMLALMAAMEEAVPDAVVPADGGPLEGAAVEIPALARWTHTIELATSEAALVTVLRPPLRRATAALGPAAREILAAQPAPRHPERLLEALEAL